MVAEINTQPNHNIPVELTCWDNTTAKVPLGTLAAWSVGLKAELKGLQVNKHGKVSTLVRKVLNGKKSWKLQDMSNHINSVYDQAMEQLRT
jgi:hypothetical protein